MSKNSTSITPTKRKKMPPRGKGKKCLMLKAIKKVCKSESNFFEEIVKIGLGGKVEIGVDDKGDPQYTYKPPNTILLSLVLNRIEPPLKAVSPKIKFKFTKKSTVYEQATQIVKAVSDGVINPDIGSMLITSLSSMVKIQEVTDIEERLKKMEEQVDSSE